MTILINGCSGSLGRHLFRGWVPAANLLAVSRRRPADLPKEVANWHERAAVLSMGLNGVDTVLHLEVKLHVLLPDAGTAQEFERVNVRGTADWLSWCERANVRRFVYFSSIKAVRASAYGPTDEAASGPPDSLYGASKWAAEQLVRQWAAADPARSALILRPAVVYGAGPGGNFGAMVEAIRHHRFFLVGKNDNIKSLVAVENLAAATRHLVRRMQPGCEIYNLVDPRSFSVREIDALIRKNLGRSGNSPSIPLTLGRWLAGIGDWGYRCTGQVLPFNSSRLNALLESTHFSGEKLLATGFHPGNTDPSAVWKV